MRCVLDTFLDVFLVILILTSVVSANTLDAQSQDPGFGPAPAEGYVPYGEGGVGERVIAGVPVYMWYRGCGPTAAGMVVGYWDTHGFGKLIRGDSSTQTTEVNRAIASPEHYNDYSLPIDNTGTGLLPDKSAPPAGDEHTSNCLADFMKTSWSAVGNYYGWSWFNDVDDAFRGYTDWANATYGASYQVASRNERWGVFSWANYTAEIDAGRPLVFLVDTGGDGYTDHFVTAIGYRETSGYAEYACLDTWDVGVRWQRFRGVASGWAWGIYGATYYELPEPATFVTALAVLMIVCRRRLHAR